CSGGLSTGQIEGSRAHIFVYNILHSAEDYGGSDWIGAVMSNFTRAMWVAGCVVAAATVMSAQNASRPMRSGPDGQVRHLVYIATPGDDGTDNQSGVVVLDADKNYSFIKRISYGLPANQMPGPKIAGIEASVPLQMLYVAANGHMLAIDLKTDAVAWKFNGE